MTSLSKRTKTLLAMLSSDNDGEALNAVRMLAKSLKSDGMDFHDLGSGFRIVNKATPCRVCAMRDREPPRPKPEPDYPPKHGTQAHDIILDIKWIIEQKAYTANGRESEFLVSILEQAQHRALTERQMAWLASILKKARNAQPQW